MKTSKGMKRFSETPEGRASSEALRNRFANDPGLKAFMAAKRHLESAIGDPDIVASPAMRDALVGFLNALGSEYDADGFLAAYGSGAINRQTKRAAKAKHAATNAAKDKLIAIWASGKYSSRDDCAGEEAAGLGLAQSTARKALQGTPEPASKPPRPKLR